MDKNSDKNIKTIYVCKYNCLELKSNMLHSKDRRKLLSFIKKYDATVAVVSNLKLKNYIFDCKESKGKYKDYAIKRLVSRILSKNFKQIYIKIIDLKVKRI